MKAALSGVQLKETGLNCGCGHFVTVMFTIEVIMLSKQTVLVSEFMAGTLLVNMTAGETVY